MGQSAPSGLAGSAASSGQLLSERNDLQSEQDVHTYFDGLEKVRDLELRTGQCLVFTNLF